MRLLINLLLFLFLSSQAWANIFYSRDGGGSTTQCTGTTNAVYPGSGVGQACAFNHPAWGMGTVGTNGSASLY